MRLVYGLGKSGSAAAKLLIHLKEEFCVFQDSWLELDALDIEKKLLQLGLPKTCFRRPEDFWTKITSLVVSPGIAPSNKWIRRAKEEGKPVLTEIELGLSILRNVPWIGVTGTNGKSTVVSYVEQIASKQGLNIPACGNFGVPVCEIALNSSKNKALTPHGLAVELSSYQLHYLENAYTLKGGAITSFAADHLSWHGSHEKYKQAKARLIQLCLGADLPFFISKDARLFFAEIKKPNPMVTSISAGESIQNLNINFAKSLVYTITKMPLPYSKLHLVDPPFRWQPLKSDPRVVNDSKSTNMHSLCFGVKKLFDQMTREETAHILVGGRAKKEEFAPSFRELKELCVNKELSVHWYCFGESAESLFEAISVGRCFLKTKHTNLEQATKQAFKDREEEAFVMLSPGCASFDEFNDFMERGKSFEKLALEQLK